MKFEWIFSSVFLLLVITKSIVLSKNVASINQGVAPEAAVINEDSSSLVSTDSDSTISYVIRKNRFNDTDHPRKSRRFQHDNKLDNFN